MIADAIASLLCFMFAISCFVIHVLTSPRQRNWSDLPPFVRVGLFLTGASLLYRGVNLAILSTEYPPTSLGHVNIEGLVALAIMSYTFTAYAVHMVRRTFPARVWDRMKYIEGLATCANNGSLAILASLGVKVVPPHGTPKDVAEASRLTDHV